jgi:hypothetical protein
LTCRRDFDALAHLASSVHRSASHAADESFNQDFKMEIFKTMHVISSLVASALRVQRLDGRPRGSRSAPMSATDSGRLVVLALGFDGSFLVLIVKATASSVFHAA